MDHDTSKQAIGARIGRARRAYGEVLKPPRDYRKADLAAALGVSSQAVGQWERGIRAPDVPTLARLAAVLGARAEWLILGTGTMREGGVASDASDGHEPPERASDPPAIPSGRGWAPPEAEAGPKRRRRPGR